jgi:hypothetical protein
MKRDSAELRMPRPPFLSLTLPSSSLSLSADGRSTREGEKREHGDGLDAVLNSLPVLPEIDWEKFAEEIVLAVSIV